MTGARARDGGRRFSASARLRVDAGNGQFRGVLELPEDFTALLGDFKPTLSVQMVDPSRPYLKPIYQLNADGVCAIPYFKTFNSKDHHEILYLSEDNGKSWHSVPSDSGKGDRYMSYNHLSIQFKNYFEPGKTYLLKMEVESPEISAGLKRCVKDLS